MTLPIFPDQGNVLFVEDPLAVHPATDHKVQLGVVPMPVGVSSSAAVAEVASVAFSSHVSLPVDTAFMLDGRSDAVSSLVLSVDSVCAVASLAELQSLRDETAVAALFSNGNIEADAVQDLAAVAGTDVSTFVTISLAVELPSTTGVDGSCVGEFNHQQEFLVSTSTLVLANLTTSVSKALTASAAVTGPLSPSPRSGNVYYRFLDALVSSGNLDVKATQSKQYKNFTGFNLYQLILRAVASHPPLTPTQIADLLSDVAPPKKVFEAIQVLMDKGWVRFNRPGTGLLRC